MKKRIITYVLTALLSAVLLFVWNGYVSRDTDIFKHAVKSASAEVLTVDSREETDLDNFISTAIIGNAEITSGEHNGEVVKVYQEHNSAYNNMRIIEPGDKIIIKNFPVEGEGIDWVVDNYKRTGALMWLVAIFVIMVLVFGRSKGLRTVVSLAYTCISVFAVFVPAVLSGKNIYLTGILVCVFIIAMTLLMVNGADKKTLCAALGCIGGVLVAALITVIFSHIMNFAGYTDEDSYYLTMLPNEINLKAIAFSAIIIGAVGAVMDVAMSISSSLHEMTEKVEGITFKSLVESGFAIGRDMMGTMANTLVLAYMGSSVSCVLLLLTYADSAADVFNREMIAYEILQAVAGSLGILLAIPLTTVVCGLVYIKRKKTIEH